MKRAFTFFFLAAMLLSAPLLYAQTDKILVKSFSLQGEATLVLQLGHPVEVRTWANETVQVQMNIHLNSGSESNLKSLIQTGRYNMASEITPDGLRIFCPALQRAVKYNGGSMNETISFVVFVPNDTVVSLIDSTTATAPTGAEFDKGL